MSERKSRSSKGSRGSKISHSTHSIASDKKSIKSTKSAPGAPPEPAPDEMPQELDIMNIIVKYFLDEVSQLTEGDRRYKIASLDALELYGTVIVVHRELANFKLENHIMVDFLEKNDPKLLVGLRNRRASLMKKAEQAVSAKHTPHGSLQHNSSRHSSKRSMTMTMSHMASSTGGTSGGEKRKLTDYRINYKTKAELAEMAAAEVERRVLDIERNGKSKVRR